MSERRFTGGQRERLNDEAPVMFDLVEKLAQWECVEVIHDPVGPRCGECNRCARAIVRRVLGEEAG